LGGLIRTRYWKGEPGEDERAGRLCNQQSMGVLERASQREVGEQEGLQAETGKRDGSTGQLEAEKDVSFPGQLGGPSQKMTTAKRMLTWER